MSRPLFLGCDVGASGSCAVLFDNRAKLLRSEEGGAGNPHLLGFEQSADVITSLLHKVLGNATPHLCAATICISGGESQALRERYTEYFRKQLELPEQVRVTVLHDVIAPLGLGISTDVHRLRDREANASLQFSTVIAGTGSVAASFIVSNAMSQLPKTVHLQGNGMSVEMRRKSGGWGPILGDAGSGYAISTRALGLSLCIIDGMGKPIPCSTSPGIGRKDAGQCSRLCTEAEIKSMAISVLEAAMKHYPIEKWKDGRSDFETQLTALVSFLHDRETTRGQTASFSSQVANLASNGNDLCIQVLKEAGEDIGQLLVAALSPKNISAAKISDTRVCIVGGVEHRRDSVCFEN